MPKGKTDLNEQEETKSIPLEDALPHRKVVIAANLPSEEEK